MPAKTKPATVEEYLASLPAERREAIQAVREVVNRRLPEGFEEGISYGMIGWYVPHSLYPAGYHCDPRLPLPFAGLGSQKHHLSFHAMWLYVSSQDRARFEAAWAKTGKTLRMGAGCIRFERPEDLALDVLGDAMARCSVSEWIRIYEAARTQRGAARGKKAPAKKATAKRAGATRRPKVAAGSRQSRRR